MVMDAMVAMFCHSETDGQPEDQTKLSNGMIPHRGGYPSSHRIARWRYLGTQKLPANLELDPAS